jgi:hypothetical protein
MSKNLAEERLVALRDELLDKLEADGVSGVISAGLGRYGEEPALVLLVNSFFRGGAPAVFEGTPVVIRRINSAVA